VNRMLKKLSSRERDGPVSPLCSRNARPKKDGEGVARCPSCSQNAHDETVLVRCAQVKGSLGHPSQER
jgi:hypothetical protein